MRRLVVLLSVLLATAVVGGLPALAGTPAVTNTSPPTVTGEATWGRTLTARPGTWEPATVTYAYRWLRDGAPVAGATATTYLLRTADLGARISVTVTATDASGAQASATSAPTPRVQRAALTSRRAPRTLGTARYGHAVAATPGRWSATPDRVRYQWLRGGDPIAGERGSRHVIAPEDVGRRLRVEVTAYAEGHRPATARSEPVTVRHRVDVRRTVTYSVTTRGHVTASLSTFRHLAQQTYDDPRGWRGKGVRFVPVRSGGSFTLVLAEAGQVPAFSSECSATYSCRVGRYVIINQTRWQHASPPWNAAHQSLRDYRNLVVNHETGHWLGKHHASCPHPGALAPVMMQQSKGTDGCRFNPWPTLAELG